MDNLTTLALLVFRAILTDYRDQLQKELDEL